ncbi:MAG: transglycosylase domain-containing protein [Acidobacteriota bacterium]|nr:transglycosylase domain-containing protein [Acidobacteriota bacterium]
MSVENYTQKDDEPAPAATVTALPRQRRRKRRRGQRPPRPRVRKLRLLFVLTAFGALAVISMLFGALTSIASDLPGLENTVQFSNKADSYMYDVNGNPIGPLAPASTPAIDHWGQISGNMRNAIVAVEDRGFWGESGISVRGLVRAALADLSGGKVQGGSTIPEEFIKNVRQEEGHRTIAEKLVEAGMAFQLSHHWTHKHILTEYLNTIYFGNGAIGIEAAARVYFGWDHGYDAANPAEGGKNACGNADPGHPNRKECAAVLTPAQAALLAGMVANPSAFNPAGTTEERTAAKQRRDLVLQLMYRQHYISYSQYQKGLSTSLPTPDQIQQPAQQPTAAPYFTSWVQPQVVQALENDGLTPKQAQYEADYGGLKIKLSIDLNMQRQAQEAVDNELFTSTGLPSASLVAISNKTGEVRAMVSGNGDYQSTPFNLATMGFRQPGSSFKLFTLAAALSSGNDLYTEKNSQQLTIHFAKLHGNAFAAGNGTGRFPVHNFGNVYSGWIPMTLATATSDNSYFAQLGMSPGVGTAKIANYAKLMGITSSVSTNPSMILGGLTHGVSALEMAHAYSTEANGGVKLYNPKLGDAGGPVGIDSISGCGPCDRSKIENVTTLVHERVLTPTVAADINSLLHGPVDDSYGTGTAAAIPGVDVAGKTGTTSNYIDAWFVGWTPQLTVAVWVGYPNTGTPMTTQYNGGPVEGGTYPAVIWHNFTVGALQVIQDESQHRQAAAGTVTAPPASPSSGGAGVSTSGTQTTSTTATTQTTQTTQVTTQPTQALNNTAGGGAGTVNPPASSSQSQTLPQSTAPPPPSGSATTGSSGGSGL